MSHENGIFKVLHKFIQNAFDSYSNTYFKLIINQNLIPGNQVIFLQYVYKNCKVLQIMIQ